MASVLVWTAAGLILAAGAGWLVLRRPDIPYAKLEAKYAGPTSHFADLGEGVRLHYRDDGPKDAPAIVLVHGYGDSFLSWEGWIARLSPRYRVLTVDLPGHGLTQAPATWAPDGARYADLLEAWSRKLGLGRVAVAGNSMGGGVAWRWALANPERLSALILVDAAGWPAPAAGGPPPLAFRVLQTSFGRFLLRNIETRPITAEGLKADVYDKGLITKAFVDRWVEVQRAPGHRAILMNMQMDAHAQASEPALRTITAPTLVLHGEADQIIPVESGRRFAQAIPNARLITYAHAGHLPQVEVPDASAADVAAFIAQHAAAPLAAAGAAAQ